MDIFKKYGLKIIDNIMHLNTIKTISYFKKRAQDINYYVHDNLIEQPEITYEFNNIEYWKGLEIICKEHYCNKNMLLHVNFSYTIKEINIDENYFSIIDENEQEEHFLESFKTNKEDIEICILSKYFKLPYCSTCHSSQGSTIDEEITIFDCNSP